MRPPIFSRRNSTLVPGRAQVFGGVKQSGLGVEGGGDIGLKEFLDVTTLRIAKTGLSGK